MPQVQTARGPIGTADLGQTLMHEHVLRAVPYLLEHGVSQQQIEQTLVGDPRRHFENVDTY